MKKLIYLMLLPLLFACSADDGSLSSEEVTLFVNHYKTTSVLNGTALVVQENEAIGSSEFRTLGRISGFDFQPGFTYNLTALKTIIKNPGTEATTVAYELIDVNSMEAVQKDTNFRVPLSTFVNGQGFVTFLRRKKDSTFVIGNEIPMDCSYLCGSLNAAFDSRQLVTGTFLHGDEDTYVLTELY